MPKEPHLQLGVVQGRLIPSPPGQLQWFPQARWEEEFALAASVGFGFVELIAEREHNDQNPVWSDVGIDRIHELCAQHGLSHPTLCNDYIINHSLQDGREALNQTLRLVQQAGKLRTDIFILPLFEQSEITPENCGRFKPLLLEISAAAKQTGNRLCLETLLPGTSLRDLLKEMGDTNIQCVFDTGNRVTLDRDIYSDILVLRDHVGHVHIKDKDSAGNNVALGTGLVDFKKLFETLAAIRYGGIYTFETCRGGEPLRTARYNKALVEFFHGESF